MFRTNDRDVSSGDDRRVKDGFYLFCWRLGDLNWTGHVQHDHCEQGGVIFVARGA